MAVFNALDTIDMGNKVYGAGDTVSIADDEVAARLVELGVIEPSADKKSTKPAEG